MDLAALFNELYTEGVLAIPSDVGDAVTDVKAKRALELSSEVYRDLCDRGLPDHVANGVTSLQQRAGRHALMISPRKGACCLFWHNMKDGQPDTIAFHAATRLCGPAHIRKHTCQK